MSLYPRGWDARHRPRQAFSVGGNLSNQYQRYMRFLSVVVFIGISNSALALCFRVQQRMVTLFSQADLVCVASVTSQHGPNEDDSDYVYYDLKVAESFKGSIEKVLVARTENDSGRTSLEVGKKYLLFMAGGKNDLINWGCGYESKYVFPAAIEKVKEAKAVAELLKRPLQASARIQVTDQNESPIAGAKFNVTGHNFERQAITGKDGFVTFELPEGFYAVTSQDANVRSEIFDEMQEVFDLGPSKAIDLLFVKKSRESEGDAGKK